MDGNQPEQWTGLTQLGFVPKLTKAAMPAASALLSPAAPLDQTELTTMLQKIQGWQLPNPESFAEFVGDDWATQGDWYGRYGRHWARLGGMEGSHDETFRTARTKREVYMAKATIGPRYAGGKDLRRWIHWLKTENPKSLYSPVFGYRRQAEWNDHGEIYPTTNEGPDIWFEVEVPARVLRLSLYFINKDGHSTTARYRDYLVEVRSHTETIDDAEKAPALARCRVRDFWGGTYKQFVVTGPGKYWLKVSRNNSHNTICSGVFIDKLIGVDTRDDEVNAPFMGRVYYAPPSLKRVAIPQSEQVQSLMKFWTSLDGVYEQAASFKVQDTYRILAYRTAAGAQLPEPLVTGWRWKISHWTPQDRELFTTTMKKAWVAYWKQNNKTPPEF